MRGAGAVGPGESGPTQVPASVAGVFEPHVVTWHAGLGRPSGPVQMAGSAVPGVRAHAVAWHGGRGRSIPMPLAAKAAGCGARRRPRACCPQILLWCVRWGMGLRGSPHGPEHTSTGRPRRPDGLAGVDAHGAAGAEDDLAAHRPPQPGLVVPGPASGRPPGRLATHPAPDGRVTATPPYRRPRRQPGHHRDDSPRRSDPPEAGIRPIAGGVNWRIRRPGMWSGSPACTAACGPTHRASSLHRDQNETHRARRANGARRPRNHRAAQVNRARQRIHRAR